MCRPARSTFLLATVPDNTGTTAIGTPTTVSTSHDRRERGAFVRGDGRAEADVDRHREHLSRRGSDGSGSEAAVRHRRMFARRRPAFHDVFTLPSTGTYTITIDPRDVQTGTMTFLLATVPDNTGTTAIGTPTTVSTVHDRRERGALLPGDRRAERHTGGVGEHLHRGRPDGARSRRRVRDIGSSRRRRPRPMPRSRCPRRGRTRSRSIRAM